LAAVQQPELSAKLCEIKAPTLVLVGTRDRSGSREAGRLCREQIPACYLVLVYDAGHAIAADRHDACLSPISDFLEQGEGFIVSHESQMIRP
jgi:pimeloyl-ACP methyl ester carboxylesterase